MGSTAVIYLILLVLIALTLADAMHEASQRLEVETKLSVLKMHYEVNFNQLQREKLRNLELQSEIICLVKENKELKAEAYRKEVA